MYFFNIKAFLILAIVTVKIIYLGFLASYISRVALIMRIFIILSKFWSSIASYIGSPSAFSSVLDSGLGSLSILFIVEY